MNKSKAPAALRSALHDQKQKRKRERMDVRKLASGKVNEVMDERTISK